MKKDKRVEIGEAIQSLIKSTGQNEVTDSVLVNRNLIPTILAPDFMSGTVYSKCTVFNIGDNTSGAKIPIANEPTRNSSGIRGGVCGYWVGEGVAKTPSTAAFSILDLGLNKACVVIYLTDEMKNDSEMLGQYVSKTANDAIKYIMDRAIVYGAQPTMTGIAGHACTGFSAISAPVTAAELKDVYDLYYQNKNGCWVFSQNLWVEVTNLWDTATQTPQIPLTWMDDGTPILWGLPVIVSDAMNDRSFVLGDFSQYVVIQKEIQQDINESLKYLEDESILRFVVRTNGSPMWVSGLTTQDGSVVHPFVMKTDDELSSSSSSSSSSVDSSSTSSHSSSSTSSEAKSSSSTDSSSSSSVDSSSTSSSELYSGSSSSSSTDDSSESSMEGCCTIYSGTGFTTEALNGDWAYDDDYVGYPSYVNQLGTYYMWYEAITGYWAMSADKGDPQISWVSTTDTAVQCPDGDGWVNESGTITCEEMSSSSSSVDSSSSSSSSSGV